MEPPIVDRVSKLRRRALPAALLGTGGILAAVAMSDWPSAQGALVPAALYAVAATIALSRGLLAQVMARAAAWLTLLGTSLAVLVTLADSGSLRGALVPGGVAAVMAAALWLGRPLLHTREARRPFDPVRFRRAFLMGSTATVATAIPTALGAVAAVSAGYYAEAPQLAALSAGMLAAVACVLRMRGVGVLLGAGTSLAALAWAALTQSPGYALLAVPPALLALPVLYARLAPASAASTPATRVALDADVRVDPGATTSLDDGAVAARDDHEDDESAALATPEPARAVAAR